MNHSYSIDGLLHDAQVAIDNALTNPEILDALSLFGYTADHLQQGKALYTTALTAQTTQQLEAGEQKSATAELEANRAIAHATYIRCVKIARVAFKRDAGIATQLDLNGERKRNLAGWLAQVNQFYINALANPAVLAGLGNFGITPDKLQAGLAEVKAVEASNLTQEKEKGEAQAATQTRDQALDALQDWLSDYLAIAKVALEDNPQLLESLGVLQRA
ncbi:hypothetical protein [Leptolyngbya iicbica]|uniref:Uncharacterized protein n=2 Tax=Cyanophyceae TaxID=3028117 RepID=A0A4Q7EHS5_9CYAN|nr:hypothetical protein [Leptolyngbya sp. LK]RZM82903.1 hypothetical protein DYY88_06820 [Leptolyngbya sp. LK]